MKWFFQPRPGGGGAGRDDDEDSAPGLLGLSEALLERHGARELRPGHAAVVAGFPPPRSTVYRTRTLLVPGDLLPDVDFFDAVQRVLAPLGLSLTLPGGGRDPDPERGDQDVFRVLRALPRVAVLVPLEGFRGPVKIDAWTALQTLRAASLPEPGTPSVPEPRVADADPSAGQLMLDRVKVERIELEHLLTGSAISGDPATSWGGGGIAGGPGSGGDASGLGATDSYLFSGGDSRLPVAVLLEPPTRLPSAECATRFGGQPVVAVLDSGVRAHPWLGTAADGAGGYTLAQDGFVAIDHTIQDAIRAESQQAVTSGDRSRQVISGPWDKPMADDPLLGELNPALGHCTAIAGIVRMAAPDARVLAVRVMCSDDILYEGDIICALHHLATRIALAETGDLAAQVSVVSLSFGYFSESRHDRAVTSGLWHAVKALLSLGVIVVAAAGNYASPRPFYPAAFAREHVPADEVPVISVGALNPNGTKAMFSNDGRWVTAWAAGAAVVTAYPTDADGSRTPELRIPVNRTPPGQWPPGREALDLDDFSAGFAVWSGTSFSAPYAAALIARSLCAGAARAGAGLKLNSPGTGERKRRARTAYETLPHRIP